MPELVPERVSSPGRGAVGCVGGREPGRARTIGADHRGGASVRHRGERARARPRSRSSARPGARVRRAPTVPGARLIPTDGAPPVEADEQGRFSIDLEPGRHTFVVRAPGFDDLRTPVTLAPGEDVEMEFRLDEALDGERYRTVVEHQRAVAVSRTTLTDEEIHEMPGSGGDPLRVINSLPGASQVAGFLPYVVVRGAAPGNTGYYLDGARVPLLFHVAIGPSVIHPAFIDSVDFYPGGAPVRLGRFTNGMIEAKTQPSRRDRVHGQIDLRLTDAGALLELPFNRPLDRDCKEKKRRKCRHGEARGALTVAGRYSYTGLILSLVQARAKIRYWDYQARLDHRIGHHLDYTAFAYGSYDDLEVAGDNGKLQRITQFQFHRIDNRIRQRLPRGGLATWAVVLGLDQSGLGKFGTNEYRIAPRFDFLVPTRNPNVTLNFGLDQEFQIFRVRPPGGDLSVSDVANFALLFSNRFVDATGGYFDVQVHKGKLEIRPGIRVDYYMQDGSSPYLPNAKAITQAVGVDPRLLVRETINDRWALRQSLGIFHQPPSAPIPIPGVENFGFERGLQRNIQGSFGYEFQVVRKMLRLEQEAYLGRLTNLQDYALGQSADGGRLNELEDYITRVNGWSYGLETMLKLDPGLRVFGWAAYTLSRSVRNFPLGGNAPSNWDQRHIINVVLGYQVSHKWRFGGRVHYNTGRPWTSPMAGQTTIDALANNRNNARLIPFLQLDLRVSRIWRWPNWQLQATLDVANATYSREVFACTANDSSLVGNATPRAKLAFAATVDPSKGNREVHPARFPLRGSVARSARPLLIAAVVLASQLATRARHDPRHARCVGTRQCDGTRRSSPV